MSEEAVSWVVPDGPAPAGRTADLICGNHTALILSTLAWPSGFELGYESACADCRAIPDRVAEGLYVAYDRREHDVRLVTAEHEAGHAVANIVLGHTLHNVSLTPPVDSPWCGEDGCVEFTCDKAVGLLCNATSTWAGPAAHREGLRRRGLLNRANIIGTVKTSAGDARKIDGYHLADWAERGIREHAEEIVSEHWSDIERLALALTERGSLTGPEVLELVTVRPKTAVS